MKKKIHKLILQPDWDYYLIGIASHEHDYRLTWMLNNALGLALIRTDNLSLIHKKTSQKQEFPVYYFSDNEKNLSYSLVINLCENGYFLAELKNVDFLLRISGLTSEVMKTEILARIKKIEGILTAFPIDVNTLKQKERINF
ncbi:MAG TPA: IPExxxVDY family protein [Bacteroidales bacterium]|nr:IPExxxVDY family protein [Bacteroidales bacterium]